MSSDLDPSAEPKLAHPYNIKVFHSELARPHDLPRLSGYITYPQPSRPYQTPLNARFKSLHQLAATKKHKTLDESKFKVYSIYYYFNKKACLLIIF